MRTFVSLAAAAALAAGIAIGAQSAQAIPFDFFHIGGDGDDIGTQLIVDVTDNGDGRVSFRFDNTGPTPSSISNIYFADGTFAGHQRDQQWSRCILRRGLESEQFAGRK